MTYKTLIPAAALHGHLEQPLRGPKDRWVLLDCQASILSIAAGRADYLSRHIGLAQHADLDQDLAAPPGDGGRHPLPTPQRLLAALRRWGINNNTQVIAYDNSGSAFAARAWWCLRWLGHEAVAVLDGGLEAYADAYPDDISSGSPPTPEPGNFEQRDSLTRIIDVNGVESRVSEGTGNLVDARDADRFAGNVEPIDAVAGHIPGAVCLPFQGNLDERQHFLPPTTLKQRFADCDANTVCYCGSGVTAAHNLLAMVHAGLPEPMLYPGSWSQWIVDRTRPIASITNSQD